MAAISLRSLLKVMAEQGASDLHVTVGSAPQLRIHGKMVKVKTEPLTSADTEELCFSVMNHEQKAEFQQGLEVDFSFGMKDIARFRANVFRSRSSVAGVFRQIPIKIPDFEELKLPLILKDITHRPNGLILVTGPTGSGKSTTLAAMLDILNREEFGHMITIEDPIEFVHPHKNCVVNQREVGVDTKTFGEALKRVLRQDPDFILVGELRDTETMEAALTMAETGHLVFGTLHTNGAVQTINRMINAFPSHKQSQVRQVLSFTLQAVVSQQLIPKTFEPGRAMACEVLIPTPAIRNLIREDKIHQIYSMMQTGQEQTSMNTMNQYLLMLIRNGILSVDDALNHSFVPEELMKMLSHQDDPGKIGRKKG